MRRLNRRGGERLTCFFYLRYDLIDCLRPQVTQLQVHWRGQIVQLKLVFDVIRPLIGPFEEENLSKHLRRCSTQLPAGNTDLHIPNERVKIIAITFERRARRIKAS
jgi:hypothetical protein